jgi:hypothetical protein
MMKVFEHIDKSHLFKILMGIPGGKETFVNDNGEYYFTN